MGSKSFWHRQQPASSPHLTALPLHIVGFMDDGDVNWWDRLFRTKAGFRHCLSISVDPMGERHVLMDWHANELQLLALTNSEFGVVLDHVWSQNGRAVMAPVSTVPGGGFSLNPLPMTCVRVVKQLLRIFDPWILRPDQLYRYLLAIGATELKP